MMQSNWSPKNKTKNYDELLCLYLQSRYIKKIKCGTNIIKNKKKVKV